MKLPDELGLDNFKYAITDEDIPMLEEAYNSGHQQGFKEGFNEGRKTGMLEAADFADQWFYPIVDNDICVKAGRRLAEAIRGKAE